VSVLHRDPDRPPRPAFSVFKRAALAAVVIVFATAGAVSASILLQVKQAVTIFVRNSHPIPHIHNVLADVSTGGPQTILVLGSDRRFKDIKDKVPARSDTMMLLRLDPGKGATSVLSVPRDLKVQIPTSRGYVTDKINAAYSMGGPALAVRTVTNLLHIPINHVVNVNFGGFQRAVNRLGCVYVDVDRRYYHSNLGLPASQQYSEINVPAGYQKLCGSQALAFVRYRHLDTDLVRAARQQDFLRQAKEQIGLGRLFGDRDQLLKIFGQYTETDISSSEAILRLLKLAFESAKNPIQEIHFPVIEQNTKQGDYLLTTPHDIHTIVDRFMNAHASSGPRSGAKPRPGDSSLTRRQTRESRKSAKSRKTTSPYTTRYPGVFADPHPAEDQAIRVGAKAGFPVYYPTYAALGSEYMSDLKTPRVYTIADRSHHRYRAYRLVVQAPGFGQYYGVQGMTWMAPPILDNPSGHIRMRGRTYDLYYDGSRLRLIAWRTSAAVYWVSNTLLETLTNHQMYGIARSLRRLGS
jgi:LCP family protein required for cell wall assembly